jgi:hypothetical protein
MYNFMKIRPLAPSRPMQTDRQTDTEKLIVSVRNNAKRPKKRRAIITDVSIKRIMMLKL